MDKFIGSMKGFPLEGNNLTVVLVILGIVLAIAIAMIIAAIQKKQVEKKIAKEEAMLSDEELFDFKSLDLDLSIISDDVEEDSKAIVVNDDTSSMIADETVIMTPVKEKKWLPRQLRKVVPGPQEKVSSFSEPNPSANDGKLKGGIQIFKDSQGNYRFRIISSNNCTIAHSVSYVNKASCKRGINTAIRAIRYASLVDTTTSDYTRLLGKSSFEIYRDKENRFRFRLTSANARNLLASQGYFTKSNCLRGIDSVKKVADFHNIMKDAELED